MEYSVEFNGCRLYTGLTGMLDYGLRFWAPTSPSLSLYGS